MTEIYEYDAYLSFEPLEEEAVQRLAEIFAEIGLEVSLGPTHLEFTYAGRDTGRAVVRALEHAAPSLRAVAGEVVCQPNIEGEDPVFEFYRFDGGELYRQKGWVVRGREERIQFEE